MVKQRKYLVVLAIFCLGMLLATPARSLAQEESRFFNVDFNYDFSSRKTVESFLKISSQKALFYLERSWYNNLTDGERLQVDSMIGELSSDFDNLIYPKLTAVFGNEWKPGIDNNEKITILFHKLKENGAGYMRTQDEFSSIQAVGSNEREMIYINSQFLFQPIVKSLVAHEFVHLIEYNQK
ncbi:MAG: hypothetical protein NTV62_00185, partial [Candidatus Gribaldobacteria bacterium]|nr:hypothetical protein [Candidatus Gribaldobacteria bacterium]